jgi:signal transduction histidine kinase
MREATREAEAQLRSLRVNVVTSLAAVVLAAGLFVPQARGAAALVVLLAWLVFEAATVTFHRFGDQHPAYRVLSMLDELCQVSAVLALIYLSGSASTPLWIFGFAKAFVWHARTKARLRTALVVAIGAYGALAAALLAAGRIADAAFTGLALFAVTIGHTASARAVVRAAEIKAERDLLEREARDASIQHGRDRIAREIHDGVGADVTALLLRLRREARRRTHPNAAALAERAQGILDELRGVVWSLRNEQGTLAELGKLIDATCRRVAGEITYVRSTPAGESQRTIGPGAALEALETARALIADAVAEPGVTRVELTLSALDALTVAVRHDGTNAPLAVAAVSIALDERAGQSVAE